MEGSSVLTKDIVLPPFEYQPFEYAELESRRIRLLSFVERHGQPQSYRIGGRPLIECWLETVDLHTNPTYEVLSCTDGNPLTVQPDLNDEFGDSCKWPIAVNGRLLYVSRNLHDALSRLRDLRRDSRAAEEQERRYEYEKTKLIKAAEKGETDKVLDCLRSGAHLHAKDEFGQTALHYAAENGLLDVVKVLLEHGASVDELDNTHRTPFACCVQRRRGDHEEVASMLLNWKGEWHGEAARKVGDSFWLESVCVDQSNTEERNAHAAMMTHVLSQARMVIAWLGVDDATTPLACKVMMENENIQPSIIHYLRRKWDPGAEQDMEIDSEPDTALLSTREVLAIMALLERSWFRRPWVAQEIAMAKYISIHCGPYSFNWSEISVLLQIVKSNEGPRKQNLLPFSTREPGALTLRGKRTPSWTQIAGHDSPRPTKRIASQT